MKRSDRIASKVDEKKIYDKGARATTIDRGKDKFWPHSYVDGTGETRSAVECAKCGSNVCNDPHQIFTTAGLLVCGECAESCV